MTEIQTLIDKRVALLEQIDELKRQDDDLSHEIACKLLHAGEKQAFGSSGLGFALFSTTRYEFRPQIYRYMEQKGLIEHFVPPPKITKTKLDNLLKEGVLTYEDMAAIKDWILPDESPYSLKKVAAKGGEV